MSPERLGGPLSTLGTNVEPTDETTRALAPPASTETASREHQAYVEDASEEGRPERQREVRPSLSARSTLERDDNIVDLTKDPPQRARPARPARPATVPAASRGCTAPATPLNTVSLARGILQGTPAGVAAQARQQYQDMINKVATGCANRTTPPFRKTYERLLGVVTMTQRQQDLDGLASVHATSGKDALESALDMLTKERKFTEEVLKGFHEPEMALQIKTNCLKVQKARVTTTERYMQGWDDLFTEISGHPQRVRKAKIDSCKPGESPE